MTTARALIRGAMRLIGVLAAAENPTAAEAFDGLEALNAFLDSASNERLTAYVIERLDVPLVPGKATYTWGVPGGDIAFSRPLQLSGALLRLQADQYEYPLDVVDQATYQGVALKQMPSLYPQLVSLETSYPLAQLHLWPVPTEANTLALFPWVPLTRFATLDAEVSFPQGYERWLIYALAVEIGPQYGKEPSATVVANLASAVAAIKRTNTRVPTLTADPAYTGRQGGQWWVMSDSYLWRR